MTVRKYAARSRPLGRRYDADYGRALLAQPVGNPAGCRGVKTSSRKLRRVTPAGGDAEGTLVNETGVRNGAHGADKFGFDGLAAVHWNLSEPRLYEHAVAAREAQLAFGG